MKKIRNTCYRWIAPVLINFYILICKVRIFEIIIDPIVVKFSPNIGIPLLEATHSNSSMEQDWDNRAKVNALITATSVSDEKKAEVLGAKGIETIILKGICLDKNSVVLEIGCGIGNLLKILSIHVKEIHGVDISGEMLKIAREYCKDYPNITLHKTEGLLDMFPEHYFDFVYSSGVFIHFPSKPLVYEYFKETARVLKSGGTFRFHVDGRNYLKWRRQKGGTVRGVVFNSDEIKENLEKYGFRIMEITGANTPAMWSTAILG